MKPKRLVVQYKPAELIAEVMRIAKITIKQPILVLTISPTKDGEEVEIWYNVEDGKRGVHTEV